ncbi:MAG: TetR/AcrR family transcriptional regulator [Brasilonema octagenarum HA4186-MV1]|jgi:AcrR family transcriptional regulator|nr:TetR/AcrR family transcriptional regulator [Brasilonema octagenarum HA4186-MV1]
MPKISEEQRQARRDQILAAVWRCFIRKGVHGTSMEDIIRESGLSAGAVYLYFTGKQELILAAISTYMGQLRGLLHAVLMQEETLAPLPFVHEMVSAFTKHTKRQGIDLNSVILMGWSEAQTNSDVKALVTNFQTGYLDALTNVVRQWQQHKYVRSEADAEDIAKALLSFFLGSIVQEALLGGADPATLTRGIEGLLGASVPQGPPGKKEHGSLS